MEYLQPSIVYGVLIATALIFFLLYEKERREKAEIKTEFLQLADQDDFFVKKSSLMRKDEASFYEILLNLVDDKYFVFPQVRLTDVIEVKPNNRNNPNVFSVLGQKSVDYVIFSKDSLSPVLAIELNGASHFTWDRKNKDDMKYKLFEKVGINLLTVNVSEMNSPQAKDKIQNYLAKIPHSL